MHSYEGRIFCKSCCVAGTQASGLQFITTWLALSAAERKDFNQTYHAWQFVCCTIQATSLSWVAVGGKFGALRFVTSAVNYVHHTCNLSFSSCDCIATSSRSKSIMTIQGMTTSYEASLEGRLSADALCFEEAKCVSHRHVDTQLKVSQLEMYERQHIMY